MTRFLFSVTCSDDYPCRIILLDGDKNHRNVATSLWFDHGGGGGEKVKSTLMGSQEEPDLLPEPSNSPN
jgi:hypothetical protein